MDKKQTLILIQWSVAQYPLTYNNESSNLDVLFPFRSRKDEENHGHVYDGWNDESNDDDTTLNWNVIYTSWQSTHYQ